MVAKITIPKSIEEALNYNYSLNDTPFVSLSDVGIAMGGLGSDTTIETADVVITR